MSEDMKVKEAVESESREGSVLTKKDIDKAYFRWWMTAEISANYERMQGLAYGASMIPILEKLYPEKDDLSEALKRHLAFFNSEATWGSMIFGSAIAMEEERAKHKKRPGEMITSYKTGLMGPVAGIGDTVDLATIFTLVSAFCCSFAMKGSLAAPIIMFLLGAAMYVEGLIFHRVGYKMGRSSVKNIMSSGKLKDMINGANMIGMFMMGALSAGLVSLSTVVKTKSFNLQETLDSIAPGILPLLVIFLAYFGLKGRKMSAPKIVILIILVCVVGSLLKVL